MPYKVIDELPTARGRRRVQREILKFWEDDNARHAEIDASRYCKPGSCATSYKKAATGLKIAVDVFMHNDKVYMTKEI